MMKIDQLKDISEYLRKKMKDFPRKQLQVHETLRSLISAGCPGRDVTDQQKPTYDL